MTRRQRTSLPHNPADTDAPLTMQHSQRHHSATTSSRDVLRLSGYTACDCRRRRQGCRRQLLEREQLNGRRCGVKRR